VGFSQLIPLILLPILTRFFSPEDFGFLAIFMAITQLIAISSTFRLEMAVVLPKKDTDAAILCLAAFLSLLFISILMLLSVLIFFKWMTVNTSVIDMNVYVEDNNVNYLLNNRLVLYLMPLSVLLLGLYNILYSWNNRMELYKNMSYSHIIHSLFSTPLSILFYFSPFKSLALIFGQIIGRLFACTFLLKHLFTTIRFIPTNILMYQSRILARKYKKFIIYETPHSILNFFSQKIIIAVFTVFFGLFTVGIFDLADKIIGKPLGVISNSFKTVFYKRLTTAKNKINIFIKSVVLMTMISCLLILPFFLIPDDFFVILLGDEWAETGNYIKLLCPLLFSRFIVNVVSPSISYTLQNHYLLIWQVLYFLILIVLFWFIYTLPVEAVLLLYSFLGAFMYILLGCASLVILKHHIKS